MSDLSTTYLGLALRTPLVCSSSPQCQDLDALRRMEDHGAGAVVLHSLFEEQLQLESRDPDRMLEHGTGSYPESVSYFPDLGDYNLGPEGYLEHIRQSKELLDIPVIASLNGHTPGGWVKFAKLIQEAGADALELNVFEVPTDPLRTAVQVEQELVELVQTAVRSVTIPVAVKLSPFYSSLPDLALRLEAVNARGLVLFNRFYEPDFDLERLDVVPSLHLSTSHDLPLRLHWVAVLFGNVRVDLAITGGVHTGTDVVKGLMAGAAVTMMTSALLKHGIPRLADTLRELKRWLEEHEYESVQQLRGSMSLRAVANPAAFERANYLKVLRSHALFAPM
jgi:dihydroorotate dehydrogenase (fumarate)